MKKRAGIFLAVPLALCCAAGSVIDDFEGPVRGWGGWSDAESARPEFHLSADAAGGTHSLEFTFPGSVQYGGVTRSGLAIPADAGMLEFWVKLIDGAMPGILLLETAAPPGEPRDVFRAAVPSPVRGAWTKVSIPLERFIYAYTKNGESRRDKALRPDRSRRFDLILIGYRQPRGVFLLDELRFDGVKEQSGIRGKDEGGQPSGVNLLPGDGSFETGPGNWIYYHAREDVDVFRGDGAFGDGCLELKGGQQKVSWVCNYLMQDVLRDGGDYVLSFYAKAAPGEALNVRLVNLQWEYRAAAEFKLTPEWKRYSLRIPAVTRAGKSFFVFDVSPEATGNVRIDALQLERGLEPTPYRASAPVELYATVNRSGEIAAEGEIPQLEIQLFNTGKEPLGAGITVALPGRAPLLREAELPPGKLIRLVIPCEFAGEIGYYPLTVSIRDARGGLLARQDAPFVVAPRFPAGKSDDFFGISTNHVTPEARLRVGSVWTRGNAPAWASSEPAPGKFGPGRALAKPVEKQLYTIIDMTRPPRWVKTRNGLPADPESARRFARRTAETVGPVAGAFELQNEPDLTLTRGGATREDAALRLAELFRVFHPEIAKTGKPLLLNVSGEGFAFAREVFRYAADSIDGLALHPYTFPRYIGPQAGYCSSPEDGNVLGQLREGRELIRAYGGNRELWIGELGWGLDYAAAPDSEWAERHAAFLARTFLLSRTLPELKRIIWFTGLGCLEGGRYEYGIWRNMNGVRPLPAAAAFAWLASIMNRPEEVGIRVDGEIKAVSWKSGGRCWLAVWRPEGEDGSEPVDPGAAAVHNLFGSRVAGAFTPGEKPYYIEIDSPETEAKILGALERRNPLAIHVAPTDDCTLAVSVRNNLSTEWRGDIRAGAGEPHSLVLAPREMRELRVSLPGPLSAKGGEIRLAARSGGAELVVPVAVPPMINVVPLGSRDWKTEPFSSLNPQIVISERNQIQPPDPFIRWTGPEDLSAKVFLAWDSGGFYLLAEVTDDKFEQPFEGEDIWRGDSMQFAFDAGNDARSRSGYDNNDSEFGTAFGRGLWRWQAPAGKSTGPAAALEGIVSREGDKICYRIRIPWSELAPFGPRPGGIAGFSAVFHDRDDGVANCFAAVSPGLSPFKNPALFRKIRLIGTSPRR